VPRFLLIILLLASTLAARAQSKTPSDFGYRHFPMRYQRDTVHILVLSRRGDEQKRKPVLFFAQGSTPSPVVLYDEQGPYRLLPIKMDSLLAGYHLVVVAKPGLPLVGDLRKLGPGGYVGDLKTGLLPAKYCQHNYLEYYVQRNNAVLRYLSQQPWVQADDITAMGHSEGSSIVARMARHPRHLRRVIYLAGSPLGRIITQVSSARLDSDSVGAETLFSRWQRVVAAPSELDCHGDSNRLIFSLSTPQNPLEDMLHSRLPIFVGYGTRDRSALLNDYLRVEATRRHRTNFSFHAYPEVEHNFFGFTNGQIDYEKGQWDRVARDFLQWMRAH
jgi:pimeloyl-ACP methyl ester carboxylesterase